MESADNPQNSPGDGALCSADVQSSEDQTTISPDVNQTTPPPPGPVEFTSVKPGSVCLKWGSPEGLRGEDQRFWVTWSSQTTQCSLAVRGLNLKIQDLSPGEMYSITVATLGDHGNKSQCVTDTFCSGNGPTSSAVNSENYPSEPLTVENLIVKCQQIKAGIPECYLLPTVKKDIDGNSAVRRWTFGAKHRGKKIKTVLMVGETGAGKTTLINTMVNHMLGVKWEDQIWFQITEEEKKLLTESHTTVITVYEMFIETSSSYLRIIDTPGYGDTTSIALDEQIAENLHMLFRSEDGISEIDAVGLVLKSTQNRLTYFQRYIFDAILSLFGKDIEENIVVFITHSDGLSASNVITALDESEVSCAGDDNGIPIHFMFNNRQTENRNENFRGAWDLGQDSMESFASFMERVGTKELKMTVDVLRERIRLEACIYNIQDSIKMEELKQTKLEQTQRALEEHKKKPGHNEDFSYEVDEPYKVKIPIKSSWWELSKEATCCTICEENCHYPGCWLVKDLSKCEVMKNGRCTVCTNRCPVSAHVKQKSIYEPKTQKVTRTSETLKQQCRNLEECKKSTENELSESKDKKSNLLEQAYQCVLKLENIALNKGSESTRVHLDFLIDKMKETGQSEKVKKLEEINKLVQVPKKSTLARLADDLVPEKLTAESVTATSCNISWRLPHEMKHLQHSFLISYQSEGTEPEIISSESCSAVITGLKPHTEYTVSVSTQLQHEIKSQAASITVCTEIPAPDNLTTEADETSVSVTWRKPTGLDLVSYSLSICKDGECLETIYTKSVTYNFSDLQTDTEYTLSICTTLTNGDQSKPVLCTIRTGKPLAHEHSDNRKPEDEVHHPMRKLIEKCRRIKTGIPSCYVLPTKKGNINENSALQKWTFGEVDEAITTKTILIVGETGAGKTTLINTIVNYMLGVEYKDQVWFHITEREMESHTTDITIYEVLVEKSSLCLRIIDTPGYGGANWVQQDKRTADNLRLLFRCKEGIHDIDAVGLVVKSTQNRLAQFHCCIFEPILSRFGEDIAKKIAVFITHSDGPPTKTIHSLNEDKVPCARDHEGKPLHFMFNNRQAEGYKEDQEDIYRAAWNLGRESMKKFLGFLENGQQEFTDVSVISVRERKRLEACVTNLKDAIIMERMIQNKLEQTHEALEKNKRKLDNNVNFLYEVEEPSKVKVSMKSSLWQLNSGAMTCTICQENCHYPECGWVKDASACIVMNNNRCTVCSGKCPASAHVKQKKVFIPEKRRLVKHAVDLKKQYGDQVDVRKVVERELNKSKVKMSNLLGKAYRCMARLTKTGSKKDCMTILPHLHFFIEKVTEMEDHKNAQRFKELLEQIRTPAKRRSKFYIQRWSSRAALDPQGT